MFCKNNTFCFICDNVPEDFSLYNKKSLLLYLQLIIISNMSVIARAKPEAIQIINKMDSFAITGSQ
jgi:hypothetical protein